MSVKQHRYYLAQFAVQDSKYTKLPIELQLSLCQQHVDIITVEHVYYKAAHFR